MEPVKSSTINAIGYEPSTKTLKIEFKNGGLYHYHEIEPREHEALMNAQSHGEHLHRHIKGRKRYTKI